MTGEAAHTRWWQTFEAVFGIPFLSAIGMQRVLPLALLAGLPRAATVLPGGALIVAGLLVVISARRELARRGQPTDPGRPTSRLVTTGVFGISRNPLYLGGACIVAGIGLVSAAPWIMALLVPSLIGCRLILIAPEERYLASRFGADYRAYAASVNRWLGRRRG